MALKNLKNKLNKISAESFKLESKVKRTAIAATATGITLLANSSIILADNGIQSIYDVIVATIKEIYPFLILLSTSLGIILVVICLLIRLISRDNKAVDQAGQFIKKVIFSWLIIQFISLFVQFFQTIVEKGGGGGSEFPDVG